MSVAAGILCGYAADLLVGDPGRGHPVAAFGRLAAALERWTYAPGRAAGAVHAAVLVAAALAAGVFLRRFAPRAAVAVSLWAVLGSRSLAAEAGRIAALLEAGEVETARARIPALVGRDPAALDAEGLARAAVESLAENTVDAVVAPLLWTAAAGAPGALAHRASNTLDAMVGHRSARYGRFGWAAARLDDGLNWPAARVAAALTVACAPLVGASAGGARRIWGRDAGLHPSPNGGAVEAAFAGALGVRLGGPLRYGGVLEERPWLGDGPAPRPAEVFEAIRLARLVGAATAALAAGAAAGVAAIGGSGGRPA